MNPSIQYNLILNSINRREKIYQEIKSHPKYKELLDIINSNSSLNKEYVILFRYYKIKYLPEKKKKKILLQRTFLDANNSTLFNFLDKGIGNDFRPGGLIQICLSLNLSFDESFDLFLACGRNLTSDAPIPNLCYNILKDFCERNDIDCLRKLTEIDNICKKSGYPNFITR